MSVERIKDVIQNLNCCNAWSLQLLKISTSIKLGVTYTSRQITLAPTEAQTALLGKISELYLGQGKKSLNQFSEVIRYDGTANSMLIYKLEAADRLICQQFSDFQNAIAAPDVEADPYKFTSAFLIKGIIPIAGENISVQLISMQNPVTTLKNKYHFDRGRFYQINAPVLSLRPTMDVVILGSTVYLLSLAGENLFNMERSYKAVCASKVGLIENASIVYGIDRFKTIAQSGHNPRKFVAFNESRLEALQNKDVRVAMAEKFAIPLDASGELFDAEQNGAADKIVKLLCDKGMIDPFNMSAVEVDGARKWKE